MAVPFRPQHDGGARGHFGARRRPSPLVARRAGRGLGGGGRARRAGGEYISEDPRLFILLDRAGGGFDLRLAPDRAASQAPHAARQISFIPAGVPLWTRFDDATPISATSICISTWRRCASGSATTSRWQHFEHAAADVLRPADAEPRRPHRRRVRRAEGVPRALWRQPDHGAVDRFPAPRRPGTGASAARCASWQLRRVVDYIEDELPARRIRLQELAELVEPVAESHFSHAFKASTGMPPHQWQTNARHQEGRRTCCYATDMSLTDVARRHRLLRPGAPDPPVPQAARRHSRRLAPRAARLTRPRPGSARCGIRARPGNPARSDRLLCCAAPRAASRSEGRRCGVERFCWGRAHWRPPPSFP